MNKWILPATLLLAFILPQLLFSSFNENGNHDAEVSINFTKTEDKLQAYQSVIRIQDHNSVLEMDLDSYVLGVLLGEIPASFETEALKAQAVATRTYTLKRLVSQSKHADAHVCTESACCQAYMEESDYLSQKGTLEDVEKLRNAVISTTGQVLTYEGNLIEATYFSCSGGQTEDAVDVWGTSVPYLQSVPSPGEEESNHYCNEFIFLKEKFLSKLGLSETMPLSDEMITATYTEGGGIDMIDIGIESYSGVQIRTLLSLPSTVFSWSVTDDIVIITTLGNGHRVGMSKYGADAMAVKGALYDDILEHYYPDTKLETFTADQMNALFDKAENF